MRRYEWSRYANNFRPEIVTRCIASVCRVEPMDGEYLRHHGVQCSRSRGCGTDGLFCRQHAKLITDGFRVMVPLDEKDPRMKTQPFCQKGT